MFPGDVLLDAEQIARCFKVSKGHIYNLSSGAPGKDLPFKLVERIGPKVSVSIVEFADYLDTELLTTPPQVPPVPVASKRPAGRPRGSKNAKLAAYAFQSDLRAALCKQEGRRILSQMLDAADDMNLGLGVDEACLQQFVMSKIVLKAQLGAFSTELVDIFINATPPAMGEFDNGPVGLGVD